MPPKGSTYWTANRVFKYGTSATSILAISLFSILAMLGHINVTGMSYTENCAGTPSDLCYLYLNFTPVRDIYVQANEMWLESSPPIKSLKLQRTWGPSWRTIYLNKTYTKNVKYAVLFHKDTDYRVRFIAEKYDPRDVIEWDINPTGIWGVAIAKDKCELETITWTTTENHYKDEEVCYENVCTKENKTCKIEKICYNQTIIDYVETILHSEERCIERTDYISYAEEVMPVREGGKCCWIEDTTIKCDGIDHDPDYGNCIENSGETIETYDLTDKIRFKDKFNGLVKVK